MTAVISFFSSSELSFCRTRHLHRSHRPRPPRPPRRYLRTPWVQWSTISEGKEMINNVPTLRHPLKNVDDLE